MKPPLILVDASSYFFRAFHALPPLVNTKGQPTGAVYGVVNMVRRLMKDNPASAIVLIFDAKGKNFRHDLCADYKAHRPPMPDELSSQFHPMIELLTAMGLPLLIIEGVEADDVIGTLTAMAIQEEQAVIISTGDKDMVQLVNEHVSLINTMSNQWLTHETVKEKYGISADQFIDYLTLIGDTSDNIRGVTKCGPKTAVKWLTTYQTLDNLIANAHEITGKIGESLRDSLAYLPLSKQLVTIKTDVALPLVLADLTRKAVNNSQLLALVQALEFKSWIKELSQTEMDSPEPAFSAQEEHPVTLITTQSALDQWLRQLSACEQFCVAVQATHLDAMTAEIVGIVMAVTGDNPVYIPLGHKDKSPQLALGAVLAALKPYLENASLGKIGHNLKYETIVFKNYGISLNGIQFDTMLESYVLNSTVIRHDLEALALNYLNYELPALESIAGKGVKQKCFDEIPVALAASFAAENARIILELHQALFPKLSDALKKILEDIEIPLQTVLAKIERHGVLIDTDVLAAHGTRLKTRLVELEKEAIELAGQTFNLNSPKQLQEVLYETLKLPVFAKTPTGQPSTAESVLQELAFEYRLPAIILEYRSLAKLISTYIDALPKRKHPVSKRVHTCYNQAVTATGRLSSSEPNLQNIPIRSEEGRLIRKAFIAPPGQVILAADYSQIELRIMAHLSADKSLLTAFANGWDIHTATASDIFQTPFEEVTHEQRRRAKAVNFGLIYGMSAFGLAKQLKIPRQDAQYYIDCYFRQYPGVLDYMETTREAAHRTGYVETIFGRRLYLPEINVRNVMRQKAAERMAINAPMQGSAADIIKIAMLAIDHWQQSTESGTSMIMQVHDELVFEIQGTHLAQATITIRQLMENAARLSVPLQVSIGTGPNWDEAH